MADRSDSLVSNEISIGGSPLRSEQAGVADGCFVSGMKCVDMHFVQVYSSLCGATACSGQTTAHTTPVVKTITNVRTKILRNDRMPPVIICWRARSLIPIALGIVSGPEP